MAETIKTQTTGYECVGIEKIEQTYEGLYDNKPNIITIYLTNGDTHQFKVMNGSQGVGIDRIEQRQTSSVSGGRNEFAIILTNGKEYTFSTYNGSGGSGSSGSFNQVLQKLNNMLMPSGKSYLYYNGSGFEWKSPDGSTSGGTADLSEYSWWGRKFNPASKMITGEMSAVTSIEFQSTKGETTIKKKLYLDENGDLCFDGNFYATGGVTALGSGGGTSGGGSSSTLYPFTIYNGSSDNDYITYDGSSAAYLKFKSGFSISKVGLGYEISATGSSGSGVTLSPVMSQMNKYLTKTTLNTPQFLYWDGTTYTWKNESEIGGGSGGSNSRINKIKLFNSLGQSFDEINLGTANTIGFMQGDNVTLKAVVEEYTNVIKISASGGSGSGSSGTTSGKLRFYKDSSEESWNGESDFKIIFGSGLNVTWDSHSQITLSATGGSGSGSSTSTSVSWENVTNKPSTFTPSSHSHLTNDINGLDSYVKGTKVSKAGTADRLANMVTLWGNNFSGDNSIGTTSSYADLRYVNNIYAGSTFDIKSNDKSLLRVSNGSYSTIHVGFDYKADDNASLVLFGNKTTIYTSGDDYRYDFTKGVFDVNTNTIHFGPEAGGGKISWDRANNAFKIEGNVYATGGITALGVNSSAITSNNLDFTFKSVTIPGNKQDKVQLTDEGLVFSIQDDIKAYYKRDSIALYDSANDACVTLFNFTDSTLTFDPEKYGFDIYFNTVMSCNTEENTLNIGIGASAGYIVFRGQSTMRFIYNNRTFNFNIAKAIEQGILTV